MYHAEKEKQDTILSLFVEEVGVEHIISQTWKALNSHNILFHISEQLLT